MTNFSEKLKIFLHDPIDKCFDIQTHAKRAEMYAEMIGVTNVTESRGPDQIASCMERSLLPKKIIQNFSEIRHPLSNGKLDVLISDKNEIFSAIAEVFNRLENELSNKDDKYKFFYLWRNLQEEIFTKNQEKEWIKYLSILPADTRVPDHSIWEHLKIASAIYAYLDSNNQNLLQNNSLFLFSIGPVQSFISQARKTQDFYLGSFILSYLTFKAMEVIIFRFGPTNIIYPDLYKQPLVDKWIKDNLKIEPIEFLEDLLQFPTIPNRFVAFLPTTNKDEITNLVNEMKKQVCETIKEAKDCILRELKIEIAEEKIKEKINSQLYEFPEIYWVAIPWKVNNRDIVWSKKEADQLNVFFDENLSYFFEQEMLDKYKELYKFAKENGEFPPNIGLLYELLYSVLEKSLGARKNVRTFKQHSVEECGRKCSVCGERDVIFFRESRNKNKFYNFNKHIIDITNNKNVKLKYIADGEGLCALCFLKRTFELYLEDRVSYIFKDLAFPSTAEIASSNFKLLALEKAMETYSNFQNYINEICYNNKINLPTVSPLLKIRNFLHNRKNLDGKNLDGYWFFEENLSRDKIYEELGIRVSEDELNNLKELYRELVKKVGRPNPYYAIIYLDGDNMGRWLSGDLLPGIETAYHTEVWKKLEEIKIDSNKSFAEALKELLPMNAENKPRKLLNPAIHASISTALRNYSLEFVRKIVEEEHLGKLIYAGGDDVLALVNLVDLLEVMHKLRWAFSGQITVKNDRIEVKCENLSGFVSKKGTYILTMGPRATASIGVVIAHYKAPLQRVIRKVFDMGKVAKSREGRDAFAICLMRRSGEERVVSAKWKFNEIDTIELLKTLKSSFDEDNTEGYLSKGFIQKLAVVFSSLKDEKGIFLASGEIFDIELMRLIERSYNPPRGATVNTIKEKKKNFINNIHKTMSKLFWNMCGNINNFINLCYIISFIQKSED